MLILCLIRVVPRLQVEKLWHGTEAGLKTGRTDSRVGIFDHLVWILGGGQELSDELVEREPVETSYLDCAVHRRPDCDIGHDGSRVIGPDGLRKGGRQMHRLPNGARLDDGAYEFIEFVWTGRSYGESLTP